MSHPAVTQIEFRMIVDGRLVCVTFDRPTRIADLLMEEKCSLGEWLRALRDSPEVPDICKD
jgi:hypothetical protein